MGRRSEHSREELHQLIVDATLLLVQQKSADNVTARQIAQAVGYTPGMLYSIFTNLQEIYLHVNAAGLESLHKLALPLRNLLPIQQMPSGQWGTPISASPRSTHISST